MSALEKLAQGKTKIIWPDPDDPKLVIVESLDQITAGDGAKKDQLAGKAILATQTTSNIFYLLKDNDIPTAFIRQLSATKFLAEKCQMLPLEVVWRRKVVPGSSVIKREPGIAVGAVFDKPRFELYYKCEKGDVIDGQTITHADPFISEIANGRAKLFHPKEIPTRPIASIDFPYARYIEQIKEITMKIGRVLFNAWDALGIELIDFKIEFGLSSDGRLVVADVIDNDSWRILKRGTDNDLSKQGYRDAGLTDSLKENYQTVALLTEAFVNCPKIILYRASESDDLAPFYAAIEKYKVHKSYSVATLTNSAHKNPAGVLSDLSLIEDLFTKAVIVTYCGRSNGLAHVVACNTCFPTIAVQAGFKDFPLDIFSALRSPSDDPVMVVTEPANAILAATRILDLL